LFLLKATVQNVITFPFCGALFYVWNIAVKYPAVICQNRVVPETWSALLN